MMVLSIDKITHQYTAQRLSDGSDRRVITREKHIAKVMNDDKVLVAEFDHEPTEQEIENAVNSGEAVESQEPADLILLLKMKLQEQAEITEILLQMELEKEGII
jgi:hypothetical protein